MKTGYGRVRRLLPDSIKGIWRRFHEPQTRGACRWAVQAVHHRPGSEHVERKHPSAADVLAEPFEGGDGTIHTADAGDAIRKKQ
jgi:hypothetical protein